MPNAVVCGHVWIVGSVVNTSIVGPFHWMSALMILLGIALIVVGYRQ